MADFIKGSKYKDYSPDISKGIIMHREIDRYSDTHPIYLRSLHRLRPIYHKFSGVIADVFCDHFLALKWNAFYSTPLDEFIQSRYKILGGYEEIMPEKCRNMLLYMRRDNWLLAYRSIEGIRKALRGLSQRMKYYFPIDNAVSELVENPQPYMQDFMEFYPLLKKHIEGIN